MFGNYFKTLCKALNTPPVSLIWVLNGMYALLSKLSRAIDVLPPSESMYKMHPHHLLLLAHPASDLFEDKALSQLFTSCFIIAQLS